MVRYGLYTSMAKKLLRDFLIKHNEQGPKLNSVTPNQLICCGRGGGFEPIQYNTIQYLTGSDSD